MKLIRRVSLLISLVGIFIIGCFAGSRYRDFFYPKKIGQVQSSKNSSSDTVNIRNTLNADTVLYVTEINISDGSQKVVNEHIPESFLGMNLLQYRNAMEEWEKQPGLKEQEKGFVNCEITSFSPEKVELSRYYRRNSRINREMGFYLGISEEYVTVYSAEDMSLYLKTQISVESLSEDVVSELRDKRYVNTKEQLYSILESYTS